MASVQAIRCINVAVIVLWAPRIAKVAGTERVCIAGETYTTSDDSYHGTETECGTSLDLLMSFS